MYRFFQYVSSFLVQYSKTKKACPCGQVFFCFLSSNEVKSRFEPLYLATMPLTTSICFFSTRSLCASDVAAKLLLGYLLLLFVGSSLATATLCFYSRWYKIRKQQTSESLTVKKVVFNYQNPVCNKLYLSLERLLN